jgi:Cys-rich protein (TIGR01571 family)
MQTELGPSRTDSLLAARKSTEPSQSGTVTARTGTSRFREYMTSFVLARRVVPYPEWKGGLFNCCENPRIACMTCLFPFCVFGYNMERLGFGQMWVQVCCFVFIVAGPCLVFQLSVHTTHLLQFAQIMTFTGLVLAWLGLLYGAYWRVQMRKKFRLPEYRWCFGSSNLTDATSWLFCCWCTLCQEVRTAEYYDVGDDVFLERSDEGDNGEKSKEEPLRTFPSFGEASKKVVRFRETVRDASRGVARLFSDINFGSSPLSKFKFDLEKGASGGSFFQSGGSGSSMEGSSSTQGESSGLREGLSEEGEKKEAEMEAPSPEKMEKESKTIEK